MRLRFCGNHSSPLDGSDERYLLQDPHIPPEVSLERHRAWIRSKLVGNPQATEHYSATWLKEQGMIGVYSIERDDYGMRHPELVVNYEGPLFQWSGSRWETVNQLRLVSQWG